MSQTTTEKLKLERKLQRIERANPDHFRFPREAPRKQRRIPFVEDRSEWAELLDEVIGALAFVGLVVALSTAPWWLS